MAEAMTRHTSEVDVYHLGPFAPLGSRHNVNHWGDGAKQPRISHSGIKEFYYFLATDERVGDLMHEQIDADLDLRAAPTIQRIALCTDAGRSAAIAESERYSRAAARRIRSEARHASDRPSGSDLEWMCYAMNWTVEWERTGDTQWRDRVTNDMKSMAAGIGSNGRLPGGYFDMIFGGPEEFV